MQLALRLLSLLGTERCRPARVLAAELGVGRRHLSGGIARLRELGLPVVAERGRGYRLAEPVQLLDAGRVHAGLSAGAAACLHGLEVLADVDSTNRHLLASRAAGVHACLSERQSAGRGRRGRGWVSPFARGLYLSVRWPSARGLPGLAGLSLAAGVAVAEALRGLGVTTVGLKWPNDLVCGHAKLGGVLVELSGTAAAAAAVVGVGVNGALGGGAARIDQPFTDLQAQLGETPDRNRLAGAVLDALLLALADFEHDGFTPFRARYAALDGLAGHRVVVHAEPSWSGVSRGVDADGALLVERAGRRHRVLAGDVSVRLAADQPVPA